MAKLRIALAQMQVHLGEPKRNVAQMVKWTEEASKRGAHIVVFPELWPSGYALEQAQELSQTLNQGLFAQVAGLAKQHQISITGSMLEKRGQEASNSAAFFASNGQMMGVYRKIHLFHLMSEDRYLQPGSSPLVMELPWGKTAMAICYDLRFPELFRRYGLEGAELVIIPAEWPMTRIDHWRNLLITRAIENQCYVVGVNTAGTSGETLFGGHSMIIDPWGKIVVEMGEDPGLVTGEIELARVQQVREYMRVFDDRRPETYEKLNIPGL
jgi:omega-amidase